MDDGFIKHLLPLATLVIPNLFKAESLSKSVLMKTINLLMFFFDGSDYKSIQNEYINTKHTHSTRCVFSSCCPIRLAENPKGVVINAKKYIIEQWRISTLKLNDHVGGILFESYPSFISTRLVRCCWHLFN